MILKNSKTSFMCNDCGYESSGWLGKCPSCGTWNSFVEFNPRPIENKSRNVARKNDTSLVPLSQVSAKDYDDSRSCTGLLEFDRVLGGGIVKGSIVLLSGDPGIGKSTLLLHTSDFVAKNQGKVIYVSGEESPDQINMRAKRLKIDNSNLLIFAQTDVDLVCEQAESLKPALLVIDSIQTMYTSSLESPSGGISQVKESASRLLQMAKTTDIPVFLVGHVNKAGDIAGPRVLEHMVDTVIHFEGDTNYAYRILRAVKNRFGSTNEVGIFEMVEEGLREVKNPSEMLLKESVFGASGSAVAACVEGTRPILAEVQALVVRSSLASPRKITTGVDYNRTTIISAVLDKRVGIHLSTEDVYVNVAGGLKLNEPAADLAIAIAIVSSFKGVPVHEKTALFGEIGLAGELRSVTRAENRAIEAARLGFTKCVMSEHNLRSFDMEAMRKKHGIELIGASTLRQAIQASLNI